MVLQIISGTVRKLTKEELSSDKDFSRYGYKWVVESDYIYKNGNITVTVPESFLTDGATGGPDYGCSWIFHDWLYATHKFDNDVECTRREADEVMSIILDNERLNLYQKVFNFITGIDICCCFSSSWENYEERGPQFLGNEEDW